MPELHDIRQAVEIRNRLLEVPASYIPLSYWSDIATAADGSIFILLALQNRHTVYKLDSDGTVLQKFTGDYGKGHLLAVHQNRLAIADAAGQQVTLYALP